MADVVVSKITLRDYIGRVVFTGKVHLEGKTPEVVTFQGVDFVRDERREFVQGHWHGRIAVSVQIAQTAATLQKATIQ